MGVGYTYFPKPNGITGLFNDSANSTPYQGQGQAVETFIKRRKRTILS